MFYQVVVQQLINLQPNQEPERNFLVRFERFVHFLPTGKIEESYQELQFLTDGYQRI
ncbi:MAG: hypothetical protein BWY72_01736 [Bacteroidetes bacterium ADurb.Bin416]|nr:MAG: hypothetical protein BWY72_01736 [Bacteroidetes bacterium ADurb.Bin416]